MAEFVQKRKEQMITEIPALESHFKPKAVKRILNQREKFEYKLMRRNKQKSDFMNYIIFLNSIINEVQKENSGNPLSNKLINQHIRRIISLYSSALKYFNHDVSLWKKYIKFLIECKKVNLLQSVIDSALLLHGNTSDEIYIFAIKQEFNYLKNIQKIRELYTTGLYVHKNSSSLYFEAFKCELAFSEILIKKCGKKVNIKDPALNGSLAKIIFESAVENVKNDFKLIFKMYQESKLYSFALDLSNEIKNYMITTFNLDPNYWDTLALNELKNPENKTEKMKIKQCLDRYDEALSIINTDEMWNKYLNTILKLTSDNEKTEIYKRNLFRQSMYNAHTKDKLSPHHYIQWIQKSQGNMANEILDWATEKYPNDTSILEIKFTKLIQSDKQSAYTFFKHNLKNMSSHMWLIMIQNCLNELQLTELFNMVYEDSSISTKELKKELATEYLLWLSKNKSLDDVRKTYNKLIMNNNCDASVCKSLVDIETKQENININKIRQHFTLACMQFGKTNIDLWMDRIYFEIKYGSPKLVSSTYHQALTTLNNEESDQFAEEYASKSSIFNKL